MSLKIGGWSLNQNGDWKVLTIDSVDLNHEFIR